MKWLLATSLFASACAPSKSCSRHVFGDSSLSIEIEIHKTSGMQLIVDIAYRNTSDSTMFFLSSLLVNYNDKADELLVSMGDKVLNRDIIGTGDLILASKGHRKVRKVIRNQIGGRTAFRFNACYILFRFNDDDPMSMEDIEKYGTKCLLQYSGGLTLKCLDSLPGSAPLY